MTRGYLSSTGIVKHKVEFVTGLKAVVESDQEWVIECPQQNTALTHDVALLQSTHT